MSTARLITIFSLFSKFLTLADTFYAVTSRKAAEIELYGFLSVWSYQGQGLCEKLPMIGRPEELNLSSFSRNDGRKCVSKREELGEETENGY